MEGFKKMEEHKDLAQKFEELESDPSKAEVFQQVCLEYLQKNQSGYFNTSFSGKMDEEGYLYKIDGTSSNTKPSQNISGMFGMETVARETLKRLGEEAK